VQFVKVLGDTCGCTLKDPLGHSCRRITRSHRPGMKQMISYRAALRAIVNWFTIDYVLA
jgi:hypothetical protein